MFDWLEDYISSVSDDFIVIVLIKIKINDNIEMMYKIIEK
jgi:hypothetical protein